MNVWAKRRSPGFTIVELLVVVVVIAVLAAVTIVAYNGISSRAKQAALQSDISQVGKKIEAHIIQQNEYPANLTSLGFTEPSYTYLYQNGTPGGYCASKQQDQLSYAISSTSSAFIQGRCVTNRVNNPSAEVNATGWNGGVNGSTVTRTNGAALVGAWGANVVAPSNNIDSGISMSTTGTYTAGTAYTATFTLRAVTAGNYSLSVQSTAGTASRDTRALTANQTAQFRLTWTPSSTGGIAFYALRQGGQSGSHTFYVDGAMLYEGNTPYQYSDGSSPGWYWLGAVNNSNSVGPAVQ